MRLHSTATLNPDTPLEGGVSYTLRVRGGGADPRVKDVAGNAFAAEFASSFTTAPPPLQVVGTTPSNGATGSSAGVAPIALFNKGLDPATVNDTTVLLTDAAGAPVPFNLFRDAINIRVMLVPTALLQPEQKYTVTLKGGSASPRITDTHGMSLAADVVFSFTTAAAAAQIPVSSIFAPPNDVPDDPIFENDDNAVELGLQFRSDVDGLITGVRFYKGGVENDGPHVGHLWTSTGTLLGSVTFSNETESGWQQAFFPTPIQITANTVYVVSYFSPQGHYANDNNSFDPNGVNRDPLFALSNSEAGGNPFGNGVYLISPQGGFPVFSNLASNYWVDVIFVPVQP